MKEINTKSPLLEVDHLENLRHGKVIHLIDPKSIVYFPENDFTILSCYEKVADGNWDQNLRILNDFCHAYCGLRDVFHKGLNWEETDFYCGAYQAGANRILNSENLSPEEIKTWKFYRCQYLNYLYRAMRQFGYVQDPHNDHVSVLIGRHGEIILNNGRHRLAAAKLLNLPAIPVLVDVRHKQWVGFKKSILEYSTRHNDMVYAPLWHFDLMDIPYRQHGRARDVLKSIKHSKTVVDFGANWGYMCKILERNGYVCTAVEGDDIEFSFLKRMKLENAYTIVNQDICDYMSNGHSFDCVLALSIFHHLAKTEDGHKKLIQLLKSLNCKEMVFQMPDVTEMRQISFSCYKNYTPDQFVRLIIDNSCLNKAKEIGNRTTRKMFYLCQ